MAARVQNNDPLEKFRFLVSVDLSSVGGSGSVLIGSTDNVGNNLSSTTSPAAFTRLGFHDIQMPKRTTTKIHYREGHDADVSTISAGLSAMEDIVMSRGLLAGDGTTNNDFYKWISAVHSATTGTAGYRSGGSSSALTGSQTGSYRGTVTITMLDRGGVAVRSWTLHQAWPVHYVPGSDLNAAEDGDKSVETLTLAYEDFTENTLATTPTP